uniref:Secreted protein n=1 Tax=Brassica oleracea TaxID=3712 RepID=A0A3P6D5L5_BRAOL|nr:unnamed protein product [Brassica oleracea]
MVSLFRMRLVMVGSLILCQEIHTGCTPAFHQFHPVGLALSTDSRTYSLNLPCTACLLVGQMYLKIPSLPFR